MTRESPEIETMRMMAWERAKGEMASMLVTYRGNEEKFEAFRAEMERFIKKVEEDALEARASRPRAADQEEGRVSYAEQTADRLKEAARFHRNTDWWWDDEEGFADDQSLADYVARPSLKADEEIARLTARVEKMEAFITDECLHPQAHPHLKEAARAALEKAGDE